MKKTLYEPEYEYWCRCDKKGKTWKGAEIKRKLIWEVIFRNGDGYTCRTQLEAEVLSRLEDIENKLKAKSLRTKG